MSVDVLGTSNGVSTPRLPGAARWARRAREVRYRAATAVDAAALHTLISSHLTEGHLLPRCLDELRVHAPRFLVALRGGAIVGCAELAPLSARVAEVRSLVVVDGSRGVGIGTALVSALVRKSRRGGFTQLCAFTHDAGYFERRGFSVVAHEQVPEKIALDCRACALFQRCGQYAVVRPLAGVVGPASRVRRAGA